MSTVVERLLREKCTENPELSMLLSQWDFDKRLVTQALQTVVRFHPHFSLHDASHANTILTQLVRILGEERLRRLRAQGPSLAVRKNRQPAVRDHRPREPANIPSSD
jgi:hypothetical protein